MDIDDVSSKSQSMAALKKQQAALQSASQRHGELPKDRKSRAQLIQEFMLGSMSTSLMRQQKDQHFIHNSWVPLPYAPSVAPHASLKKIHIRDLRLETHHRGCYVLLRVATLPSIMTAVMVIVEDEKDDAIMLQLYQQDHNGHESGEESLETGQVCVIREPYFKIMTDGEYGLRVDHLSDVTWLSIDDPRIPTPWRMRTKTPEDSAHKLKELGNRSLKAGKLSAAVEQ